MFPQRLEVDAVGRMDIFRIGSVEKKQFLGDDIEATSEKRPRFSEVIRHPPSVETALNGLILLIRVDCIHSCRPFLRHEDSRGQNTDHCEQRDTELVLALEPQKTT